MKPGIPVCKSYVVTEFARKRAAVSWKSGLELGVVHWCPLMRV